MKQRRMLQLYNTIENLYGSGSEDFSPGYENYTSLAIMCEDNSISLFIMSYSGDTEFSYGNEYYLLSRLTDIIFTRNSGANIIKKTSDYTLQTVYSQRGTRYIEIWGNLSDGSFFIARSSYSAISNSISSSLTFFLIITAVLFFMLALLMSIISKSYTDTIKQMNEFAQAANEGDFEAEFSKQGKHMDELGLLGENIYEMSQKLEKTISELKTTNLRLENELREKQEIEEARKKYMSDVAHELKTPIAIISGYAEGLKEGISSDPEDTAYYCDVIIDESEKMNIMIKKLATLNQLENGRSEVSLERFDVVEAIDGFLNTMHMVIEENNAVIYFNNTDSIFVWADEFLFEEVMMNFFNNAINHLDENRTIRINAEHYDDENVRVTVFNSGENIAEDEINRIWGKFYKIDKARTREYGGSGLGLSIVKAVADSLGKECGVYNLKDGVAFWIDLESASAHKGDQDLKEEKPEDEKKIRHRLSELPIWQSTVSAISNKKKMLEDKMEGRKKDGSDK